jgi:probable rRNA maturation factor
VTRVHRIGDRQIDVTVRPGVRRVIPGTEAARVVAAALAAAGAPAGASLSVILTDDAEIETLNVAHLGHEGPTDVLSFPLLPPSAFPVHPGAAASTRSYAPFVLPPGAPVHLGDIVVSIERAVGQAAEGRGGQTGDVRWSGADEVRLLLTHGALHICGWDHAEPEERAAMRALEQQLLATSPD